MDTNAVGSSVAGASAEKIAALPNWRESELFSAEAQRHFSDEQLVELAATVAMENYRARFNRTFLVESQHFYDRRLAAAHGHAP